MIVGWGWCGGSTIEVLMSPDLSVPPLTMARASPPSTLLVLVALVLPPCVLCTAARRSRPSSVCCPAVRIWDPMVEVESGEEPGRELVDRYVPQC